MAYCQSKRITKLEVITISGYARQYPQAVKFFRTRTSEYLRYFRGEMIHYMGEHVPVSNAAMLINLIDSELNSRYADARP